MICADNMIGVSGLVQQEHQSVCAFLRQFAVHNRPTFYFKAAIGERSAGHKTPEQTQLRFLGVDIASRR